MRSCVPLAVLARGADDHRVVRDELVEVVEALVVAHVRGDVAALPEDHVRALVLEAAERGVLHGRLAGLERVDLDDPAEAVRLVLVAGGAGVVAGVDGLPAAGRRLVGEAVALVRDARARGAEVAGEVLLAGEHGAPRGGAAGAVAERAEDARALGVVLGAQRRGSRGRARHGEGRVRGDAAVAVVADRVGPRLADGLAAERDDGHAVRGLADAALLGELGVVGGGREHDVLVRVLVVGDEERLLVPRVDRDDVEVVVVVAELARRELGRLVVGVEVVGVAEERVAPADDRLPAVSGGDGELVDGGVDGRDRRERQVHAACAAAASAPGAAAFWATRIARAPAPAPPSSVRRERARPAMSRK